MANITTTEAAGFVPEIWLQVALGRLKSYLTIQKCVTKDTDLGGGTFSVGATLHVPRRGALTVNDKSANTDYTAQNPTADTVDLTLNKHKEVTFLVESRALAISNQDFIAGYVEDAAIALAEQIDTDLFGLYSTVASYNAGSNLITGGATIAEADILSARKILVDAKVPASAMKYGIIDTAQTNGLLQIDPLVRYDALGVSNNIVNATVGSGVKTMDASIGRLYGFEISESQLVPLSSTYKNLFFARDAFMFASRPLENPDGNMGVQATVITDPESGIALRLLHSYQHLKGAHCISLDVLYGVAVLRVNHAVLITTSS